MLDAIIDDRRHVRRQFFRADGQIPRVPIESDTRHTDAANLHVDVGLLRGGGDPLAPGGLYLFYTAGVGAGTQQTADMAQDDGQVRYGFGKLGQFFHLGEEHPAFQRVAHAGQDFGAGPEVVAGHLAFDLVRGGVLNGRIIVPGDRVADAAEPVGTGCLQGLQNGFYAVAQVQVGVTDDGGGGASRSVEPCCTGGGQTLDEFNLANRLHLVRPVDAVHGPCLHKNGGAHVVAAVHIVSQLVEQVPLEGYALSPKVPEVVVGVADGQVGLQGFFRR